MLFVVLFCVFVVFSRLCCLFSFVGHLSVILLSFFCGFYYVFILICTSLLPILLFSCLLFVCRLAAWYFVFLVLIYSLSCFIVWFVVADVSGALLGINFNLYVYSPETIHHYTKSLKNGVPFYLVRNAGIRL